jgi:hypothetical protein
MVMKTFKDIQFFEKSMGGNLKSLTKFDNGFEISVIAGEFPYSTPRENNTDPDFFSEFEVAVFNSDGELGNT